MSARRKKRKAGLTLRWMAMVLGFTAVVSALAVTMTVVSVRQSYYASARQVLDARVMETRNRVNNEPYEQRAAKLREHVENFGDKDHFEMMLINEDGLVTASSSGYAYPGETMYDFEEARESENGHGSYIGYSQGGEHLVAVTQILTNPIGDTVAIRYVSSLQKVDLSVMRVMISAVLIAAAMLAFIAAFGMYFIRSIVVPLGKIGQTASRIAGGDFDVRVENVYNDEIGDLCDIINNMAGGLSESDKIKNEFISNVSHELRTPLTAIKGWGETIKSVGPSDEDITRQGIDIIISETERLSVLVEDLLDFSRLQSGSRMRFSFEKVDIAAEMDGVVRIFERRAAGVGLEIRYTAPEEPVFISGDRNRLRQVFSNIIDNAIKYSRESHEIAVTIAVGEHTAQIGVRDTGIGIPKNELPSITERFYKASNSLTGSGIGLAVVKEIVTRHCGTVDIESELGAGTTVTVRLPLLKDGAAPSAEASG
jgi:signal transduction histidine kinase